MRRGRTCLERGCGDSSRTRRSTASHSRTPSPSRSPVEASPQPSSLPESPSRSSTAPAATAGRKFTCVTAWPHNRVNAPDTAVTLRDGESRALTAAPIESVSDTVRLPMRPGSKPNAVTMTPPAASSWPAVRRCSLRLAAWKRRAGCRRAPWTTATWTAAPAPRRR